MADPAKIITCDQLLAIRNQLKKARQTFVFTKGGDYAPAAIVGREHVEAHGGQVRVLPLWPDLSTSQLVERIKALPSA